MDLIRPCSWFLVPQIIIDNLLGCTLILLFFRLCIIHIKYQDTGTVQRASNDSARRTRALYYWFDPCLKLSSCCEIPRPRISVHGRFKTPELFKKKPPLRLSWLGLDRGQASQWTQPSPMIYHFLFLWWLYIGVKKKRTLKDSWNEKGNSFFIYIFYFCTQQWWLGPMRDPSHGEIMPTQVGIETC